MPAKRKNNAICIPNGLREAWCAVQGVADFYSLPAAVSPASLCPISAEICRRLERDKFQNMKLGALIKDQGIYLGIWEAKDQNDISLRKKFYVFAAPENLPIEGDACNGRTYSETVRSLSVLKKWYGFDGANYTDDIALYKALAANKYKGQWVIPTLHILLDAFKKGLICDDAKGNIFKEYYWSCSTLRYEKDYIYNISIRNKVISWDRDDFAKLCCRPVRLVKIIPQRSKK